MKSIDMGHGVRVSTPILSAEEAAAYLGLTVRHFRKLSPPPVLVGGERRYDVRVLDEWIKNGSGFRVQGSGEKQKKGDSHERRN